MSLLFFFIFFKLVLITTALRFPLSYINAIARDLRIVITAPLRTK